MHLDDEQVERARDGEATTEGLRHVEACASCADRVARARAEVEELATWLAALDPPSTPAGTGEALRAMLARAAAPERSARPNGRRWRVAAAAAVLVVVAGVAFALPGSPLRAWWNARVATPAPPAPASVAPERPEVAVPRSGVAIEPGLRLVVRFAHAQPIGTITIRLVDEPVVSVLGTLDAAAYASEPGRLVVDNRVARGGSFEVRVPRAAPRVEIEVAGRRVFTKDGSRITTPGGAEPTRGGDLYVVPFAP